MTIKEFAQLCACNPQTLRYYDKIGLLKPSKVDPWSGYRYYAPEQALDFVKIKNLQAADFSIEEIKALLPQSEKQVYEAFDRKIAQQEQKLERIREIQKTYLTEKATMEQIIYSMTDYLLKHCNHPEVLTEFGLSPADAPAILARLKEYLNASIVKEPSREDIQMVINEEVIQDQEAILARVQSLTKDNLEDTISLNTGSGHNMGHETEKLTDPEPDFSGYEILWERRGWEHVSDFFGDIPLLMPGKTYCLWLRTQEAARFDDLSVPMFFMGAVLYHQGLEEVAVNCAVSTAEGSENHFRLLCKEQA